MVAEQGREWSRYGVLAAPPIVLPLPDAAWTRSQTMTAAEFVLQRLRAIGVRVPPDNRLERARRLLQEAFQTPWSELPERYRARVLEAARTIMEQYLIVRAVGAAEPGLLERLRWLLEGLDPPGQSAKTAAHDVQFELLMGAALRLGGVLGVRLGEPDWTVRAGDREIGLAVKRVVSLKGMFKQVRKAIGQLRRHGQPGFILLNLDRVRAERPAAGDAAVSEAVKDLRALVARCRAEDVVFGLFGFATAVECCELGRADVLGVDLFGHAEIIEPDLSQAPKIEAWLGMIGQNIVRAMGRVMGDVRA